MKKLIAGALLAFTMGGCSSLNNLYANPTVVSVVDGIRSACGWEADSSAVQALLNAGIPGLTTIQTYVGAFCAAANNLPVAAVQGTTTTQVVVAGIPIRAQRAVK